MIGRGEQLRVELGDRQVLLQGGTSPGGGGGHAREPVEPLDVVGSQAGGADRGQDPLWQQRTRHHHELGLVLLLKLQC